VEWERERPYFSIQVLIQRARDVNCDVSACFIDFEKAFDEECNTTSCFKYLYLHQRATVRIDNETSQEFTVNRGVRQGCVLSPTLFNTYSEILFRQALNETEEGIKINGENINNLRYADDTVLIADSAEGLQELIDRVAEACDIYGMRLNCKKTKILIVSKNNEAQYHQFRANNESLETADTITYLGCSLNEEWDYSREMLRNF